MVKIKISPKPQEVKFEDIEFEKNLLKEIYERPAPYLRVIEKKEGLEESKKLFEKLKGEFKNLIVIGIGGSILGTEAIVDFCKDKIKNLYFLDNIDSRKIKKAKKILRKGSCGVCVISKSGKTLETNLLFSTLLDDLKEVYKDNWKKKVVAITSDKENILNKWAKENNIEILFMPEDLSGRFSVFSPVGIFPLLFEKINVEKLLQGAKDSIQLLKTEPKKNIISSISFILLKHPFKPLVIFTYGSYLYNLGRWFQQLWAESLGKDEKFGQIPLVAIGTQDQHSILQMISDVKASSVTWIWRGIDKGKIYPDLSFINLSLKGIVLNDYLRLSAQGVYEALKQKGVEVLLLDLNKRNEYEIGKILSYFMLLCHYTSLKISVETFNQPAVELSKNITYKKLREIIK
jgi:glucose-6-phosphate isomerase